MAKFKTFQNQFITVEYTLRWLEYLESICAPKNHFFKNINISGYSFPPLSKKTCSILQKERIASACIQQYLLISKRIQFQTSENVCTEFAETRIFIFEIRQFEIRFLRALPEQRIEYSSVAMRNVRMQRNNTENGHALYPENWWLTWTWGFKLTLLLYCIGTTRWIKYLNVRVST